MGTHETDSQSFSSGAIFMSNNTGGIENKSKGENNHFIIIKRYEVDINGIKVIDG